MRFEKNYLNAWVAICKHKAFQGMVKCKFLIPCGKRMFVKKTHVECMAKKKKNIRKTYGARSMRLTYVV